MTLNARWGRRGRRGRLIDDAGDKEDMGHVQDMLEALEMNMKRDLETGDISVYEEESLVEDEEHIGEDAKN